MMVADVVRTGLGVAATPVQALARGVRRMVTGPKCVLDVPVRRLADVRARTQWLDRFHQIGQDSAVAAVLLRIEATPGGWAATADLRSSITALRGSGTPVYAMVETPGTAVLWLASACDEVICLPTGQVSLLGIGAELTFFGAALEQLGVAPDFEAAGAYKSFGEAYTRSFASVASQEAIGALIEGLHGSVMAEICEARGLSAASLDKALADAPLAADEAFELGLVDALRYEDQLRDWLKETHGKGIRLLDWARWAGFATVLAELAKVRASGDGVAVLYLDGPIVMDRSSRGSSIRARKVIAAIRQLRHNDRVKAVVLYVNSPGGSALASDLIWREVDLLHRDKPVVACFEDVAASGGYYLSAPAHEIMLRKGTLTGSIGVFGGKVVLGGGLRKLGVHSQQMAAAPNVHVMSASQRFTPAQRVRFRQSLERVYGDFVQRVATGRDVPEDEIEPHCRGRVWTGTDAVERGLADGLGGLADAVERARVLASLPRTAPRLDVSTVPRPSVAERVMQQAVPGMAQAALPPVLSWAAAMGGRLGSERLVQALELLTEHSGQAMAMMPFDVDVL
ncbi:MAG: S49 family peptidase [Myxococcota bacterium]